MTTNLSTSTTSPASQARRSTRLFGVVFAGSLLFAACGGSSDGAADAASEASSAAATSEASSEATASVVTSASSSLGEILVDANGMTLYGFTQDSKGTSTCEGGCAAAWPPVLLDSADLPAGLDSAVFSVIERSDGTHQLQAGKWPLYLYAADSAVGDTTGQAANDVWFVVDPQGGLIS